MEKICRKCGQSKDSSEFPKRNRRCKDCVNARTREWYKANPSKREASTKKWFDANKERVYAINRLWRKANPEKVRELGKKWKAANPERYTENEKNWRKENPEKKERINKRSNIRHPEHIKARQAITLAVAKGTMKSAKERMCSNCKTKQAVDYHHYKGYKKENWLDVIPLCKKCHTEADRK